MSEEQKSFYKGEEFSYARESIAFTSEVCAALRPIYAKYLEMGYSIREIGHLAAAEAYYLESRIALERRFKIP